MVNYLEFHECLIQTVLVLEDGVTCEFLVSESLSNVHSLTLMLDWEQTVSLFTLFRFLFTSNAKSTDSFVLDTTRTANE